ncbi:hypothetical Protein YC6258_02262 [Gynuella sunshinyii YC6258]|uniref:Uncharacterized protein n=1 Tax=Gynuella sunshinyii YC6258 TaxID=1445510 RepID=A0A0C5V4A3_9GAMM|nr:hypothetical Protein YC6258_02262 [Gynuella sunshinyii YC6258]
MVHQAQMTPQTRDPDHPMTVLVLTQTISLDERYTLVNAPFVMVILARGVELVQV